ncbi:hypothetical protein [Citrobacter braakii]|uniref:hypothetical protein n=1 Tax=Citrobacter braakii TaxID=57706 RepID=UPI00156191DE|nr:hypothetical protein [Citrobacter braakii]NRF76618.1 hypothetical protein [Citrobacter braakii]
MSEVTDLTVIEIKAEQAPALYQSGGLDDYLEQIRQAVNEVPDLSTKKGRDRVASLAASVSRSKTAIEKPGREYLKRLKEAVRPAEAEIKRFVDACDELRDATRRPLTEWEAEQERIAAEKAAEEERLRIEAEEKAAEEALKKQRESDHEMALLMNDAFDREAAEKKAEAERQRIAHEEELKRQAAEQAKREAEEKAAAELAAAKKREEDAIAAKAQAELLAKQAKERAEREAKEAQERTAKLAQEAREQAEREKQEAIAAEQRKAQEEADRIKREAEQKEAARLAEERRIADEKAKREADVKHRKAIGTDIVNSLTANTSISREQAIEVLTAMMNGLVPHSNINY